MDIELYFKINTSRVTKLNKSEVGNQSSEAGPQGVLGNVLKIWPSVAKRRGYFNHAQALFSLYNIVNNIIKLSLVIRILCALCVL